MVGHEIDDHPQTVRVAAGDQFAEFIDAPRRIRRVIRADVEIIPDRIRAPCDAFQDIRRIRRPPRIRGTTRLLDHPGEPEVGETHLLDRRQRGGIDVGEFSAAVFRKCAVRLARLAGVAEKPRQHLIDHRTDIGEGGINGHGF